MPVKKCTRCRGRNTSDKKTCDRCRKARSVAYFKKWERSQQKTNDTRHEKEQ